MPTTGSKRVFLGADEAIAKVCKCDCHFPGRNGIVVMHFRACCGHSAKNLDPHYGCPACGKTFDDGELCLDVRFSNAGGFCMWTDAYHKKCAEKYIEAGLI